jgi:hypothetical protein
VTIGSAVLMAATMLTTRLLRPGITAAIDNPAERPDAVGPPPMAPLRPHD